MLWLGVGINKKSYPVWIAFVARSDLFTNKFIENLKELTALERFVPVDFSSRK
jgi:hypothetical protein